MPSPRMLQGDRIVARRLGGQQPAREVEADAVGLARADHVPEPETAAGEPEHVGVAGDERLASQLAGAVRRDGNQRPHVLRPLARAELAVDAAAGGVEDPLGAGGAHRLDDRAGERGPLGEVDGRLTRRARDVGVGRQVDDDVVPVHGRGERPRVLDVAAHGAEARVGVVLRMVPRPSRRVVVVERDACGPARSQQLVGEMTADESGTTDDEEALRRDELAHGASILVESFVARGEKRAAVSGEGPSIPIWSPTA